jgi:pimeloyl-ACP methyl ester carboxylesterase
MKLNFLILGNGPPLIILHGLLGSLDNWIPLASTLAVDFSVFALDLRNHGRSPHADEFDYEVMAADVAEFIRDHDLGRVHLLGHSMGGKTAMRFAQLHPAAVARLVVADISPRAYPPRHDALLDALLMLDLKSFQRRNEIDVALAASVPEKPLRQFLLKNLGRDATGAFHWKPNLRAIRENYPRLNAALPVAPRFDGPTLFVRGGDSDYVTEGDFADASGTFPQSELRTIAGAGHWVHADAPADFARIVRDFLTRG